MEKFKAPLSGAVLGAVVEAFELRTVPDRSEVTDVLQDRTARTYFDGGRVKEESAHRIIRAVAEGLVAAGLFPTSVPGCTEADFLDLLTRILAQHASQWDYMVSDLAVYTPSLERPALVAFPYLRFAVIDIALRLASLMYLVNEEPSEPKHVPAWARSDGRSALLHELIGRCAKRMTRDQLVCLLNEALGREAYTFSTVDRWLAKQNAVRPVQKHLEVLADIFAREIPGESRSRLLRALRVHYGMCDLCDRLTGFLSRRVVEALACALFTFTMCARKIILWSDVPVDQLPAAQLGSLARGTAFPFNKFVLKWLWHVEELPLWKTDLLAAFGGIAAWRARIEHYVRALPAVEEAARLIRERVRDLSEDEVLERALWLVWSRVEDLPPEMQEMQRRQMDADPLFLAAELEKRGLDFVSTGNFVEAATFFLNATLKDPTNASMHFNLAAALTSLGQFQEALKEAHVAALLDPGMETAVVQVGIVLIELGRYREAIEALEAREGKLRSVSAHYFYHLGLAYYHDGQHGRALDAFERCLLLEGDHPDSLDVAAACLLKLGDRRRAWEYAKRAHHLGCSETWNRMSGDRACS